MQLKDFLKKKIFDILGLAKFDGKAEEDRLFMVNDAGELSRAKVREYDVWYSGDSDELLNFYTKNVNVDYGYEPVYMRNKRGYFWSVSATESDIKRTHSGQPRNVVDTLVSIVGEPEDFKSDSKELLDDILEENNFWDMYSDMQMPMTFVEGWGAYKIDWNLKKSDKPILKYYKANDVTFVEENNRVVGMIFYDYFVDKTGQKYLVTETRHLVNHALIVTKNVFKYTGETSIVPTDKLPEGMKVDLSVIKIDYNKLLAVPCVFYKDTMANGMCGRSIFTGKIDLFDDLDQCLSQSSNTVRRSTAIEYFNTDFLERDRKTGLPVMPRCFDRKYTGYTGGKNADGASNGIQPVQVTQPQLQFNEYSTEATNILIQIINGVMSPATLGIDIARKDNADAQREKEKITIFTRNTVIKKETRILKELFNQLLVAYELMHNETITETDYNVSIKYSEFADTSYENKLGTLGDAYIKGMLSTDMYISKLYGDSITEEEKQAEKEYLESNKDPFSGMGNNDSGMGNEMGDMNEPGNDGENMPGER